MLTFGLILVSIGIVLEVANLILASKFDKFDKYFFIGILTSTMVIIVGADITEDAVINLIASMNH